MSRGVLRCELSREGGVGAEVREDTKYFVYIRNLQSWSRRAVGLYCSPRS